MARSRSSRSSGRRSKSSSRSSSITPGGPLGSLERAMRALSLAEVERGVGSLLVPVKKSPKTRKKRQRSAPKSKSRSKSSTKSSSGERAGPAPVRRDRGPFTVAIPDKAPQAEVAQLVENGFVEVRRIHGRGKKESYTIYKNEEAEKRYNDARREIRNRARQPGTRRRRDEGLGASPMEEDLEQAVADMNLDHEYARNGVNGVIGAARLFMQSLDDIRRQRDAQHGFRQVRMRR